MKGALRDILQMGGAVAHRFLAIAAEHESGFYDHLLTVGPLALELALRVGIEREDAVRVGLAGLMHDIGKVALSRDTLCAPRPLTQAEWALMHRHPEIGAQMVAGLNDHRITHMIRCHHERLDGSGYGMGLTGSEISLPTRVLSVADAYAVMCQGRPYAEEIAESAALARLSSLGHLYDLDVIDELRGIEFLDRAA